MNAVVLKTVMKHIGLFLQVKFKSIILYHRTLSLYATSRKLSFCLEYHFVANGNFAKL